MLYRVEHEAFYTFVEAENEEDARNILDTFGIPLDGLSFCKFEDATGYHIYSRDDIMTIREDGVDAIMERIGEVGRLVILDRCQGEFATVEIEPELILIRIKQDDRTLKIINPHDTVLIQGEEVIVKGYRGRTKFTLILDEWNSFAAG